MFPLYLVALALGIATQHLYGPVVGASLFGKPAEDVFMLRNEAVNAHFFENLALHLTMLHGILPDDILPYASLAFSGPLWSISLEWQFYLIAPLLIAAMDLRKQGRWLLLVIALMLAYVAARYLNGRWESTVSAFLPLKLPFFLAGIAFGIIWSERQKLLLPVVAAAVLLITAYLKVCEASWIVVMTWCATFAAAYMAQSGKISFAPAILVWIGQRSYGLYILHMPLVLVWSYLIVLPNTHLLGQYGTFFAVMGCLPITVGIAALGYKYVEQPGINFGKKLSTLKRS